MDGVQVATATVKQSKLKEALRNNYVKTAILIVIVLGSVVSLWFGIKAVLRTEYPFMAVASPSMDDPIMHTLRVGDLIVVQGYADPSTIYAAPKPNGDIVVFWHWDPARGLENWVHRAIEEFTAANGKSYFRTQGDANYGPDYHYNITTHAVLPGLPEEYVVGKVVTNVPVIGQVALFLQTPSGRIIIVALVVALLIVEFIPFSKWKKKEQVPEREQVKA
jgi:signal peptidase I